MKKILLYGISEIDADLYQNIAIVYDVAMYILSDTCMPMLLRDLFELNDDLDNMHAEAEGEYMLMDGVSSEDLIRLLKAFEEAGRPFDGTVVGVANCSLASASISEFDIGYVVSLTVPDSIGGVFTDPSGKKYSNCVVIYRTRARYYVEDRIKGTMYLDDQYSAAYCTYHVHLNIPEGVCYTLED